MKRDRILIEKELIPYKFNILLGAEVFFLTIKYNEKHDLFTVGLEDKDGTTICEAEPLIYGMPLWKDMRIPDKYPALTIIPYDESGKNNKITWDNFGSTTFLYIDNAEEEMIPDEQTRQ